MHRKYVITDAPDTDEKREIALRAAEIFEQLNQERNGPYFQVVPATEEVSDPTEVSSGDYDYPDLPGEPTVANLDQQPVRETVRTAIEDYHQWATKKMVALNEWLETYNEYQAADTSRTPLGAICTGELDVSLLFKELRVRHEFSQLFTQWENANEVYDLTGYSLGDPIRHESHFVDILEYYNQPLYLVTLLMKAQ